MFIDSKKKLINRVKNLIDFAKEFNDENMILHSNTFYDEIKEDLTFNVLCLGDFSSGKSTFINKFFLKNDLLPTGVSTTTAKLTIIKYGEPKIIIKFKGGITEELLDNSENALKDYVAKGGARVDDIEFVEVYVDSEFLKEGVIIVDSPGLNDPEVERMQVTLEYIKKADSVLYLLTAMQAWKKSEKDFLEEKILRKEDLDKIFFLLNYWDIIDEQSRDELLAYVDNEMHKSLEIASAEIGKDLPTPPIIPISAKTKENFDILYDKLWKYLGSKKGEDILQTKHMKFENLKSRIQAIIEEKIEIQKKERIELSNRIEQLKEEIINYEKDVIAFKNKLRNKIEYEVNNWLEDIKEFYSALKEKIISKLDKNIVYIKDKDSEKINYEIKKIIMKTVYVEEDLLKLKNKNFLKKIKKIADDEKARLDLNNYLLKKEIKDIDLIKNKMEKTIKPSIKDDYLKEISFTGIAVAVGIALSAAIPSPLAPIAVLLPIPIIGLGGYRTFLPQIGHSSEFELAKQLQIIEDEIEQCFFKNINKLYLKKDEITDNILDSIKNDIVEAYEEKVKLYEDAIKRKESNKDDEIINLWRSKIKRLSTI